MTLAAVMLPMDPWVAAPFMLAEPLIGALLSPAWRAISRATSRMAWRAGVCAGVLAAECFAVAAGLVVAAGLIVAAGLNVVTGLAIESLAVAGLCADVLLAKVFCGEGKVFCAEVLWAELLLAADFCTTDLRAEVLEADDLRAAALRAAVFPTLRATELRLALARLLFFTERLFMMHNYSIQSNNGAKNKTRQMPLATGSYAV